MIPYPEGKHHDLIDIRVERADLEIKPYNGTHVLTAMYKRLMAPGRPHATSRLPLQDE